MDKTSLWRSCRGVLPYLQTHNVTEYFNEVNGRLACLSTENENMSWQLAQLIKAGFSGLRCLNTYTGVSKTDVWDYSYNHLLWLTLGSQVTNKFGGFLNVTLEAMLPKWRSRTKCLEQLKMWILGNWLRTLIKEAWNILPYLNIF